MTPDHRAPTGRRTLRLAALVATAAFALAACSSAATPAPTLPSIAPPTPTPVATPTPTPDPDASATPDLSSCPKSWDQIPPLKAGETKTVTIQTDLGNIVTEVSGDLAPTGRFKVPDEGEIIGGKPAHARQMYTRLICSPADEHTSLDLGGKLVEAIAGGSGRECEEEFELPVRTCEEYPWRNAQSWRQLPACRIKEVLPV